MISLKIYHLDIYAIRNDDILNDIILRFTQKAMMIIANISS